MRATRAVIHLENLRHNIQVIRRRLQPGIRICSAVKADAYGHGAVECARVLLEEGSEALAVASVEEAEELRTAGIDAPLLLLGLCLPEDYRTIAALHLEPFVSALDQIQELDRAVQREKRRPLKVHIAVETGMGRLGFMPHEVLGAARLIQESPGLELEGLATHFPQSDTQDPQARLFTLEQSRRFDQLREELAREGIHPPMIHAANSGAILDKEETHFTMVRPGILLYGYYPSADQERVLPVRPVMEVTSRIVLLRKMPAGTPISYGGTWVCPGDTWIATIPAGYGDGVNRLLSNRGEVLLEKQRCPIRGRVCMDQLMIEVPEELALRLISRLTKDPPEVTLFGPDPRGPDAEETAALTGTIPYETLCAVSKRVPRIYRDSSAQS